MTGNYNRRIRKAAVLGAGVMGAQIAAHLANAGIPVLLYELAADGKDPNANVQRALKSLQKLKPAPLAVKSAASAIQPANYDQDLDRLSGCDLIIEAIAERLDWKHDLYRRILPHLGGHTLLVTNTSGIRISQLGEALPAEIRSRFCGVHFFNPPRYMPLLELIPHADTLPDVLDTLEGFLTTTMGKGVIRARDTPCFIGNRVGVFSMLATMHHAQRLGLPFDLVDKLTGAGIGRPRSATFRTADVVGLDTFAHVVDTLASNLPDDPWRDFYQTPGWMLALIEKGALGQKTGAGIYKKEGRDIHVLDVRAQDYRRVQSALDERVRGILNERDPAVKFAALQDCDHPQAEFLVSIFRDLFHYCAVWLGDIAHSARDVDLAMRWGYGWKLGPFETWQAAGWGRIAETLAEDIHNGKTMSTAPLPDWVHQLGRDGIHRSEGSWSAATGEFRPPSAHPVYLRQPFREGVQGDPEPASETVFENDAVRLWHTGDEIAILSFNTKMHTVHDGLLDGMLQAVEIAEREYKGLVIWQPEQPFCAGANLQLVISSAQKGAFDKIQGVVAKFQQATMALKHSQVPTVAAVEGLALGGGCEFILHCDRTVAALESYIGLVEVGVGLIPGAGGCKEMALRAADEARGDDLFPFVSRYYERIALGKVSGSALEAREMGYLKAADPVIFNAHELLHVAKIQVQALFETGYRAPVLRNDIRVLGAEGAATLKAQLVNMLEGGFISDHDYLIGSRLATVICGGDVDRDSLVSDEWLLRLEIETFMDLLHTEKTQERIQHMLKTGKPLRN